MITVDSLFKTYIDTYKRYIKEMKLPLEITRLDYYTALVTQKGSDTELNDQHTSNVFYMTTVDGSLDYSHSYEEASEKILTLLKTDKAPEKDGESLGKPMISDYVDILMGATGKYPKDDIYYEYVSVRVLPWVNV